MLAAPPGGIDITNDANGRRPSGFLAVAAAAAVRDKYFSPKDGCICFARSAKVPP
jgi:hypothetical protein